MVYNEGQEGIDAVRLNSGNVLGEYPDTEITKKIKAGFGKVQLSVKRKQDDPYLVDEDIEYEYAKQIELNLATMYALKAYGPEFIDKIKELREEIAEDLPILVTGTEALAVIDDTDTEDIEDIVESTDPKSWNLNPDVPVPNRMTTKHTSNSTSEILR